MTNLMTAPRASRRPATAQSTVRTGRYGQPARGQWLKALADARYAMDIFNIILTPNYNAAHYNHFHVDLTPGGDYYD